MSQENKLNELYLPQSGDSLTGEPDEATLEFQLTSCKGGSFLLQRVLQRAKFL